MTADEQRNQKLFQYLVLANDYLAQLIANALHGFLELGYEGFGGLIVFTH